MMDPNAAYGASNGPMGVAQGTAGTPNGYLGALLGGAPAGSQTPTSNPGALDPGTLAALQVIIPSLSTGSPSASPQGGGAGPSVAAPSKSGQPGTTNAFVPENDLASVLRSVFGGG